MLDEFNVQIADPELSGLTETEAREVLVECCGFLDKDIVERPPFPPGVPSEDAQFGAFTSDLYLLRRMFVEQGMDVEMISKVRRASLRGLPHGGFSFSVVARLAPCCALLSPVPPCWGFSGVVSVRCLGSCRHGHWQDCGQTPLQRAAFDGRMDVVRMLVEEAGAHVDTRNDVRGTCPVGWKPWLPWAGSVMGGWVIGCQKHRCCFSPPSIPVLLPVRP